MSKKILVAEDQDMNRVLLRDILLYHGYEVFEAANGKIAVELAKKHLPELILMDIQMPVMDGFTAIALLKDDPATQAYQADRPDLLCHEGRQGKIMRAGLTIISRSRSIQENCRRL